MQKKGASNAQSEGGDAESGTQRKKAKVEVKKPASEILGELYASVFGQP